MLPYNKASVYNLRKRRQPQIKLRFPFLYIAREALEKKLVALRPLCAFLRSRGTIEDDDDSMFQVVVVE